MKVGKEGSYENVICVVCFFVYQNGGYSLGIIS